MQVLSAVKQKEREAWYLNILNYANDSLCLDFVFVFKDQVLKHTD